MFRHSLCGGRTAAAVINLQRMLSEPDMETHHYLQAWHFLRLLGHAPPPKAPGAADG
ncbi:MAG: hypothetical protein ACO1TE_19385 [Prosthecobacter sp.]